VKRSSREAIMSSKKLATGQESRGRDGLISLLCAIVESSDDAVVSKTLDGIITSWNPAAEKMFGYTANEAVGQSIRIIIPADRQSEEDFVLDRIRSGQKVDHFETVRKTKDGRLLDISLTVSPIKDASGTVVGASKVARDITARRRLESLLTSIISSSDDAIVSKTLDGIVTSWNTAAERIFGYRADEMIGRSIRTIIPADRQAEEDFVLNRIRRGQRVEHFETIRRAKDGHLVNISLTVSPIITASGMIVGASKIARDITARIAIEREREEAFKELKRALAARDEFIAIAAHELRNPLNVLTLMWQISQRQRKLDKESPGLLIEKSKVQLARLNSLIDRLLDISRIRSGTFDLYLEEFDLADLIRDVAGRFVLAESENPISLELDALRGTWDRLRLDQVITNLVGNAVKFGQNKPIEVRSSLESEHALVTVRDHGMGIPRENLDRVFEQFERGEPRKDHEGLGLGLWISREIIMAHGGTISVESELGKGATFVVRLPLQQSKDHNSELT
jgi:PAS domain S-box-containing protein